MRHGASRRYTVLAALLAFAALFVVGAASLTSSTSDRSAVTRTRTHEGVDARPESHAPRSTPGAKLKADAHPSGPHVDAVVVLAALAGVALLLLAWVLAGRVRHPLPRLLTAPLGARAPPAVV